MSKDGKTIIHLETLEQAQAFYLYQRNEMHRHLRDCEHILFDLAALEENWGEKVTELWEANRDNQIWIEAREAATGRLFHERN